MVTEGARCSNQELASFLADVRAHGRLQNEEATKLDKAQSVVVMALQIYEPAGMRAQPALERTSMMSKLSDIARAYGGQLWEQQGASALICWLCPDDVNVGLCQAVAAAQLIRELAEKNNLGGAFGVCPGKVRLQAAANRPPDGWELAGPFYMARWLMNLSTQRGRIVTTKVGALALVDQPTQLLGQVAIEGGKTITLFGVEG